MAKMEKAVRDFVLMVEREELSLPEMQREYVWQGPRVRDLLDSLYRGYPSGVILAWESDEEVATREAESRLRALAESALQASRSRGRRQSFRPACRADYEKWSLEEQSPQGIP